MVLLKQRSFVVAVVAVVVVGVVVVVK